MAAKEKRETHPLPRFGDAMDAELLADQLEQFVERLRAGKGYLQGVHKHYESDYNEFDTVSVTIKTVGQSDIPLFDSDIHGPPRYPDNDD